MNDQLRLGGETPVRRLGFGAMRLPSATWHGPPRDAEAGRAVLRRAIELGIDHIDTSQYYRSDDGTVNANVLIREALHPYPPDLVIATKLGPVFGPRGPTDAPASGLRALVEENLETLGLDRLDLVYLRLGGWGEAPRVEAFVERFEALAKLREEGLIRHLGLSNVDAQRLAEARAIAPVASVQNQFGFADRTQAPMVAACARDGIAFVGFGPIGGGDTVRDPRLSRVAERHDATVSQVALAWLLARSPVTLAIPGTGSIAHLEENVRAASLSLTADDVADLE